jgi:hypothetical protein
MNVECNEGRRQAMRVIHTLAKDSLAQYLREHRERMYDLTFQDDFVAGFVTACNAIAEFRETALAGDVSEGYRIGFAAALYRFGID